MMGKSSGFHKRVFALFNYELWQLKKFKVVKCVGMVDFDLVIDKSKIDNSIIWRSKSYYNNIKKEGSLCFLCTRKNLLQKDMKV